MDSKTNKVLKEATARFTPSAVSKSSTASEPDIATEARIFRACFFEVEPKFNPGMADREVLNTIFAWIWKDDKLNVLKVDYDKGFFLYGHIGRGKSMTLKAMQKYMNSVKARHYKRDDYRLGAWWKTASVLANVYAADGQPALIRYASDDMNLIIDEVGREPIPASNYGTKMNVLQFLLQLRYDNRRSSITHITTNNTPESLEPLYGDYVADRCKEMFNFIEFNGESLR